MQLKNNGVLIFAEQMIHKVMTWKDSEGTLCLRKKLFYLQKELLKERTRNTTLEEQLKPVNIHRWRLLEVRKLVSFFVVVFS